MTRRSDRRRAARAQMWEDRLLDRRVRQLQVFAHLEDQAWAEALEINAQHDEAAARAADGFTTAPMFATVKPGQAWLDAQDAGLATYTVYDIVMDPDLGEDGLEAAGSFLDKETAVRIAAGHRPIMRDQHLVGHWLTRAELEA